MNGDTSEQSSHLLTEGELRLENFFPDEVAKFMRSPVLKDFDLIPIVESGRMMLVNPCGIPAGHPLADPLPAVAKLTCVKHDNTLLHGSAFLIAPGVLLTAGHNLLPRLDPAPANHVMVKKVVVSLPLPGGGLMPVAARRFAVSQAWHGGNIRDRDYGIIFIPPTNNFVIPPKIMAVPTLSYGYQAALAGYPAALSQIYISQGYFTLLAAGNLIGYQVSTCPGESGGPVFTAVNNQLVSVAVQAYGPSPGLPISFGPLVDTVMQQELIGWLGYDVCV